MSGGTATVDTAVTFSAGCPPVALAVLLEAQLINVTAAVGSYNLFVKVVSGSVSVLAASIGVATAGADGRDTCVSLVPQSGQQVFYVLTSALTGAYLSVNGYTVANGDS